MIKSARADAEDELIIVYYKPETIWTVSEITLTVQIVYANTLTFFLQLFKHMI